MANIYQLSETIKACIKLDEEHMVDTDTGEILDVDGDCGGYNLQWAWSSGYLAGQLKV